MADRTLEDPTPETTWADVLPSGTTPVIKLVTELAGLGVECSVKLTVPEHPELGTLVVSWTPDGGEDDDDA